MFLSSKFSDICLFSPATFSKSVLKGGYLDFSHLFELKKYMYITEIHMKKQYKSSITKNDKIKYIYFFMVFP